MIDSKSVCGVGVAAFVAVSLMNSGAHAGVRLLSNSRSVSLSGPLGNRSSSASHTGDWYEDQLQGGTLAGGVWNGATQFSSFLPEGAAATGEAVFAMGSARSSRMNALFEPDFALTARSSIDFGFIRSSDSTTVMDVALTSTLDGDATFSAVMVALMGPRQTPVVWSHVGKGSVKARVDVSAAWAFHLTITASSRLTPGGAGGLSQFAFSCTFSTIPGPSALCMVALSAFLRRRRI